MKKELNKDFWDNLINKGIRLEIEIADLSIVTPENLRALRNELNLSQSKFANIFGVSKKTIEKWEQGANPIKGAATRLIYLIMKDSSIMTKLYSQKLIKVDDQLFVPQTAKSFFVVNNTEYEKNSYSYPKIENNFNLIIEEKGESTWKTNHKQQFLTS